MNSKNDEMARAIVESALPVEPSLSALAHENSSLFVERLKWGTADLLLWVDMELRENANKGWDLSPTFWLRAKNTSDEQAAPIVEQMDSGHALDALKNRKSPTRACIAASPEFLRKLRAAIPSVDAICSNEELRISVSGGGTGTRNRRTL